MTSNVTSMLLLNQNPTCLIEDEAESSLIDSAKEGLSWLASYIPFIDKQCRLAKKPLKLVKNQATIKQIEQHLKRLKQIQRKMAKQGNSMPTFEQKITSLEEKLAEKKRGCGLILLKGLQKTAGFLNTPDIIQTPLKGLYKLSKTVQLGTKISQKNPDLIQYVDALAAATSTAAFIYLAFDAEDKHLELSTEAKQTLALTASYKIARSTFKLGKELFSKGVSLKTLTS